MGLKYLSSQNWLEYHQKNTRLGTHLTQWCHFVCVTCPAILLTRKCFSESLWFWAASIHTLWWGSWLHSWCYDYVKIFFCCKFVLNFVAGYFSPERLSTSCRLTCILQKPALYHVLSTIFVQCQVHVLKCVWLLWELLYWKLDKMALASFPDSWSMSAICTFVATLMKSDCTIQYLCVICGIMQIMQLLKANMAALWWFSFTR